MRNLIQILNIYKHKCFSITLLVRFLPSNYIGSSALSKSLIAVSEKDTRLVPKNGENPLNSFDLIPTQEKKCRIFGTFLMLFIFS